MHGFVQLQPGELKKRREKIRPLTKDKTAEAEKSREQLSEINQIIPKNTAERVE